MGFRHMQENDVFWFFGSILTKGWELLFLQITFKDKVVNQCKYYFNELYNIIAMAVYEPV